MNEVRVFISVVSHGHSEVINKLDCLGTLNKQFKVVVKNNKKDTELLNYCGKYNITCLDEEYYKGFGYNNNYVFNYCINHLGMDGKDIFIVLNPDVIIHASDVEKIKDRMLQSKLAALTINLYKDEGYSIPDPSIRQFPEITDFISSFLKGENKTIIDKKGILYPLEIDWCAGSFIALNSAAYGSVKGFNIKYFMYCEDIDLCWRLKQKGYKLIYFPDIKAIHFAKHNNRRILSRHFFWHLKSVLLFILTKNQLISSKSNLCLRNDL